MHSKITPADHMSTAVVWLGHLSKTSGALKPGVPARGAFWLLLHVRKHAKYQQISTHVNNICCCGVQRVLDKFIYYLQFIKVLNQTLIQSYYSLTVGG